MLIMVGHSEFLLYPKGVQCALALEKKVDPVYGRFDSSICISSRQPMAPVAVRRVRSIDSVARDKGI